MNTHLYMAGWWKISGKCYCNQCLTFYFDRLLLEQGDYGYMEGLVKEIIQCVFSTLIFWIPLMMVCRGIRKGLALFNIDENSMKGGE